MMTALPQLKFNPSNLVKLHVRSSFTQYFHKSDLQRLNAERIPGTDSESVSLFHQPRRPVTTAVDERASVSKPKPFKDIPGPRGIYRIPYLGSAMLFKPLGKYTVPKINRLFNDLFEKYGPIVRANLGSEMVLIYRSEDVEELYKHEGKYPSRGKVTLFEAYLRRNGLRDLIIMAEGENWKRLRSPLDRILSRVDGALKYLDAQEKVAEDFCETLIKGRWDGEQMNDFFFRYTLESIGVVCYNRRLGLFDPNIAPGYWEYIEGNKKMFELLWASVRGKSLMHNFYRNNTYKQFEKCMSEIYTTTTKLLEAEKAELENNKKEGKCHEIKNENNLLHTLMANENLDAVEVADTIMTLISAGTDSTAKTIQTMFYNLASNPHVQDKLHAEVVSAFGVDGPITKEVMKLPYLSACIQENFRAIPIVASSRDRTLQNEIVLAGYSIPAGTPIIIPLEAAYLRQFKNTSEFLPERWLRTADDRKLKNIPKYIPLSFSHGARRCVGKRVAEQEISLAASKMVQKAKIGLKPESKNMTFHYKLFAESDRPLEFTFTRRKY